jgi:hypothetical protein
MAIPQAIGAQLRVERRVSGDTTIVRTVGTEPASATRKLQPVLTFGRFDGPPEYVFGRITGLNTGHDGSIWVFDAQVPALRQFDTTGRYIKTIGRGGEGPGEYGSLVSLAFPRDGGAIVLSFPSGGASLALQRTHNAIQTLSASGALVSSFAIPSVPRRRSAGPPISVSSSGTLVVDTADALYVSTTVGAMPASAGTPQSRPIDAMIRYLPNGTARDTILVPALGLVPVDFSGTGPYMPRECWAFTRLGHLLVGRTDRYQIHIVTGRDRIVRVERDIPRIRIGDAERQSLSPASGTYVPPREKPYFSVLRTDHDGRVWVKLHTPSEQVPASELAAARAAATGRGGRAAAQPANRAVFRESGNIHEVFGPDGRYLGRVDLPEFNYPPAIRGNTVWMQKADTAGVPVVVKYRIVPPLPR